MTDELRRPKRLRELGEHDEPGLDAAARERVIARLRADGPAVVRRSRFKQIAVPMIATGTLLLAAAALLVWIVRTPHEPAPIADTPQGSPAPHPAPTGLRDVEPTPASRRCEAFSIPTEERRAAGRAGAELLLGDRATVAMSARAELQVSRLGPCETELSLSSGSIRVHARDLGGGTLRVQTPAGDAVVHGTAFEVSVTEEGSELGVVEGVVAIVRDGQELARLTVGERATWQRGAADARRSRLSAADVARIRLDLGLDDVAASSIAQPRTRRSADELLRAGDAARTARRNDEARALYREATERGGVLGESAWIRLVRLELDLGRLADARRALAAREGRYPAGSLAPEAAWLEVKIAERANDARAQHAAAERLVARWPASPQAQMARRWLAASAEEHR